MKKDICFILLFLFVTASSAFAQLIGFESSEVPEAFKTSGKGEAKISSLFERRTEEIPSHLRRPAAARCDRRSARRGSRSD